MEPGVPTSQGVSQERWLAGVNYIKSVRGILKIVQMVGSILAFILSMSSTWGFAGSGWVNFASINGFIQSLIWGAFHLFSAAPPILANYLVELIIYGILTLFLTVAGIVAACGSSQQPVVGAAAVFCFICMVAFGIDACFQFWDVHYKSRTERPYVPEPSSNPPDADNVAIVTPDDVKMIN